MAPSYKQPGVYLEEASPPQPIMGVDMSTAAFVGPTATGALGADALPVCSFADFEARYGGPVSADGGAPDFMWASALAFFANGGERLFVSRIQGDGGARPDASAYEAGLAALEAVEEVAVVAGPGSTAQGAPEPERVAAALVDHAERTRVRFALIDSPSGLDVGGVSDWRARFESSRAALYYPWVRVSGRSLAEGTLLPPSGFVAGVYARSDRERGVYSAPANQMLASADGLELNINTAQQDVLNPLGVNCLRSFAGRGLLVWGARTLSTDSELKYVSTRRYLSYVERAVKVGLAWTVFETSGEPLWARVRQAVEVFLYGEWQRGALTGAKVKDAAFVRCDASTMTAADRDAGDLVCLIGLALIRPAEFIVLRLSFPTARAD